MIPYKIENITAVVIADNVYAYTTKNDALASCWINIDGIETMISNLYFKQISFGKKILKYRKETYMDENYQVYCKYYDEDNEEIF